MSFVDLATLALHRRHELEARINSFLGKCDNAIEDIQKLKMQAKGFVGQLNCEPTELKDRFLTCMKQLDEFTYLITDFNLAVGKIGEVSNLEYMPVHDTSEKVLPVPQGTFNLMDTLSEPTPSTTKACSNHCPPERPQVKKIPKEDQLLIAFSSSSCSAESVPGQNEKPNLHQATPDMKNLNVEDTASSSPGNRVDTCNLPAQQILQTDHVYSGTIMHVDVPSFWVITDNCNDVYDLMMNMTEYYKKNKVELNLDQVMSLTYCAYYDDKSDCYYRALFIRLTEEDMSVAELFLVDTGEVRFVDTADIQPLVAMFCDKPPYARCCHLAGVDLMVNQSKDVIEKQDQFMHEYIGKLCDIEVDDNTSESLGVYVITPSKEILNKLIVQQGLALLIDKPNASVESGPSTSKAPVQVPPEFLDDIDITQCPEYEDPVEAVTGYHNRDEADICKHYKGGPEKTCFKGTRCTKKHVLKHPDGWTLDRVAVAAKCKPLPLPPPGTWQRVLVTHVAHFDRFYVQFVTDKPKETLPEFGVKLALNTLEALVRDMNSPATRIAYKALKIVPAPGELVAALYPLDKQWYRARVLSCTRADQNVEVMYIDYGNVVWVQESEVRQLEARHAALGAQAARAALAGVHARTRSSHDWARARARLADLVQDRTLDAHVIARDYDELTLELFDSNGYSIAEQLATTQLVELKEYSVIDDSTVTHKLVVP